MRCPKHSHVTRIALTLCAALSASVTAAAADRAPEQTSVLGWRAQRLDELTGDTGWLTLAGLFWLKEGDNSSAAARAMTSSWIMRRWRKPPAPSRLANRVRFLAQPGAGVLLNGTAVDSVALHSDAAGEPTVLASGPLRFFVIERGGKLGVRVRDLKNPRRLEFHGLQYFPISDKWVVNARFVPYPPDKRIRIVNILGMEEEAVSPGALEFTQDGREWHLDTVLERPGAQQLFIMFADTTSGQETYGGGRFLDIPLPVAGSAVVDFTRPTTRPAPSMISPPVPCHHRKTV